MRQFGLNEVPKELSRSHSFFLQQGKGNYACDLFSPTSEATSVVSTLPRQKSFQLPVLSTNGTLRLRRLRKRLSLKHTEPESITNQMTKSSSIIRGPRAPFQEFLCFRREQKNMEAAVLQIRERPQSKANEAVGDFQIPSRVSRLDNANKLFYQGLT